jgi:hypothetical protein
VVEEVEAAVAVLASADTEEEARLAEVGREEAARQRAADGVPGELRHRVAASQGASGILDTPH